MSQSPSPAPSPPWLHWLEQCPSTNSWAAKHSATLQQGDVVFTRQQTAGRGQYGRIWYSPPGVLTASFVLDQIPLERQHGISLTAGLAVIYALEDLLPERRGEFYMKWPNDVFLQGRKLAGILCESVINHSTTQGRVVVGIGLNRWIDWSLLSTAEKFDQWAISLHQGLTKVPDEFSLLERLRHYLLEAGALQAKYGITTLLPALRQRDFLIGKWVTIETASEQVLGEAAGINDQGYLRLRLADGTLRTFVSGHVIVPER